MVELRWIKMFLFLILGHQFTAVTGQTLYITVRDGDEATLSCENVMTDQDKCGSTSWIFSHSSNTPAVDLITLGQISENAKAKSDRLSVTADCSLVIKKVTVEDVGLYTCRQYDRSGNQQGRGSLVLLSVVSMTEHKDNDKVKLSCSVSILDVCRHTVKWLYKGRDLDKNTRELQTSQSTCLATVLLSTSHFIYTPNYMFLKCEVKHDSSGKVQLYNVSRQLSGENPKESTSTTTTTVMGISTKAKMNQTLPKTADTPTEEGWLRFLIVSVGLTALIIMVVSVSVWTKSKGNKTQISDNAVHDDEDGDEATVNYENVGEPSASIRLH